MKKRRLDEILIEKLIASDKDDAFVRVTEGLIFVDGQKAVSPAQFVKPDATIEMRAGNQYVGRGAHKLEAAIKKFCVTPKGKICADIGSATGGFSEVLLQYGAKKVYAIDTARGKLALKIRNDPRVIVMEKTDFRDIKELPDRIDLVTIDVSLISLRDILSHAGRFLQKDGEIIALFKPQYETRDQKILKHGVVQDGEARKNLLNEFIEWAAMKGWKVLDCMESPIRGSKGNVEYVLYFVI